MKMVVNTIDETLNEIDRLIPQFESLSADEDVKKLKELRQRFQDHKTKISSATDSFQRWAAARSYTESSPRFLNDLGRISAKIELPLAFDDFTKSLREVRPSLQKNSLESFLQNVEQQNGALKQLSPKERAEEGPWMIGQFVHENMESFKMILIGNKGNQPEFFPLNGKPRDDTLRVLSQTPREEVGEMVEEAPKPGPHASKSLVIIVDGWLKADMDYFLKSDPKFNPSGIKITQVKSLVEKELEKVKKEYRELSYNEFTWDFDICEIKDESPPPRPQYFDEFPIALAMVATEESCKTFSNNFSKYENIILYPSERGYFGGKAGLRHRILALLFWRLFRLFGDKFVFTGIQIPMSPLFGKTPTSIGYFSYDGLDHELGHSLGFPHADAYQGCEAGYGSQGCQHVEYGDYWDIMGSGVPYYIAPDVVAGLNKPEKPMAAKIEGIFTFDGHLNCYYKEARGWVGSKPVTAGNYPLAPLDDPSPKAPQCLVLKVNQDFVDPALPCSFLYIESRTAREKNGGEALMPHCISPLLPPNNGYGPSSLDDLDTQTQLIFVPDAIGKGEYWDTNLGYDIAYSLVKGKPGEVHIISYSPCKDGDKDGYRKSGDPEDCRLRSFEDPDCDDADPAIKPGATEICDGKDNNCDGLTDKVPFGYNEEGVIVNIVGGLSICKTCKDTDFGMVGGLEDVGGVVLAVAGTVTLELNGEIVESKTDHCGGKNADRPETAITEYFCGMKGPEAFIDEWVADCAKFGKVCKEIGKGAICIDAPDCADEDGDGFQVKDSSPLCKFNGKQDCNDNLIAVHPGAKEICGNKIDDNCDGRIDEGCTPPQPIAMCNSVTTAGGNLPDTRTFQLGKTSGSFTMIYTTYTVPDRIDVYYQGSQIWSSGCVGTGQLGNLGIEYTSVPIRFNGTSTTATVVVTPNCNPWNQANTTEWAYKLNCP